jgi:hypothetical protein
MAKKRKTKKLTVKRSKKRFTPNVDFFTSDVSDEALERAGLTNFAHTGVQCLPPGGNTGIASCINCVILAVDNLRMLIPLRPNKKA